MNINDLHLIKYPAEILDQQVATVDIENPGFDVKELKERMTAVMVDNGGIGLSANQVGLDAQVFVFGSDKKNLTMAINPMVLQHTIESTLEYEGCLSFPGIFVKVPRPKEILVEFYNENLEKQTVKIEGYSARVFLHEYDHLQGIVFKDRVSKMKWDRAKTKLEKIRKKIS